MTCAAVIAVIVLLFLLAAYWAYRTAFYSPPSQHDKFLPLPEGEKYDEAYRRIAPLMQEMDELSPERVYIRAFDGIMLSARYFHVKDGAPVNIQFHGYRSSGTRDFCGGSRLARDAGQNTLVIDQRAHGLSGGRTITFGIRERHDCLSWISYICERFGADTPVILSGVSMGAATVLMAAGLELPENTAGIVADCPYSSPEAIIRKVCGDMRLPVGAAMVLVRVGARLFGGFDIREASAVESVKHSRVPILLIHGEGDKFVPCEMSRDIYKACASPVSLETFPDAGHGMSYIADTERYKRITMEFFEHILGAE